MLTSRARETLRGVQTVIIDEIHALAPTKRGAHLMLSLERLEAITDAPPQRIGLSATQRPLDEIARFLGGQTGGRAAPGHDRRRRLAQGARRRGHRPGRRHERAGRTLAPRRAPTAGVLGLDDPESNTEHLAARAPAHPRADPRAPHHDRLLQRPPPRRAARREPQRARGRGARARAPRVARARATRAGRVGAEGRAAARDRRDVEPRARHRHGHGRPRRARRVAGLGRARAAAHRPRRPPGRRAEHRQDLPEVPRRPARGRGRRAADARGPRRGDALPAQPARRARAADRRRVRDRRVERRRPVRARAPVRELRRALRRRVPRDARPARGPLPVRPVRRLCGRASCGTASKGASRAREGAQRVAVQSGGTIPDRGLFGVFLPDGGRVGELDEEMVYESRVGECFVLGASTWRIEEITVDRVVVTPAPGEPAKTPFWHGDQPGPPARARPRARRAGPRAARARRRRRPRRGCTTSGLDVRAASNLRQYLDEQAEATGAVPDDRTIVVERFPDEIGDWRVCILTPFGSRVHAPWALAIEERLERADLPVQVLWSDDGIILRLPESVDDVATELLLPDPDEIEELARRRGLPSTSLFASKFRENAARALLLPRRRPGERTPLWQQRQRAADLLEVASGFPSFPMLLETTRECLRDVFDVPALARGAHRHPVPEGARGPGRDPPRVAVRAVAAVRLDRRVHVRGRRAARGTAGRRARARPRPAARPHGRRGAARAARPRGARRARARAAAARAEPPGAQRRRPARPPRRPRAAHRSTRSRARSHARSRSRGSTSLARRAARDRRRRAATRRPRTRRACATRSAGRSRRDCPSRSPIRSSARSTTSSPATRARTCRSPLDELTRRLRHPGRARPATRSARLEADGRVVFGEFRPGGVEREWCDANVLRILRRRSLAALRHEIEPVDAPTFARFLAAWQGVGRGRRGIDALVEALEQLQGVAIPASVLERDVLPGARRRLPPRACSTSCARRASSSGSARARSAPTTAACACSSATVCACSRPARRGRRRADGAIHDAFRDRLLASGRELLARARRGHGHRRRQRRAHRALGPRVGGRGHQRHVRPAARPAAHAARPAGRRGPPASRPAHPPRPARGRGPLVARRAAARTRAVADREPRTPPHCSSSNATASSRARRCAPRASPGGFAAVYPVLRALEESGRRPARLVRRRPRRRAVRARRARSTALRAHRTIDEESRARVLVLAATDPAQPYGAALAWPERRARGPPVTVRRARTWCSSTASARRTSNAAARRSSPSTLGDRDPTRPNVGRGPGRGAQAGPARPGRRSSASTTSPRATSPLAPTRCARPDSPTATRASRSGSLARLSLFGRRSPWVFSTR